LYIKVKRILDILASLILITVFAFPMLIISVILIAEGSGTVLFCQQRPGKNGKLFKIFKFRTMLPEISRNGIPLTDIERITKFGAFLRATSFDETPQLFNVLKGDMSFIGPRPLLVDYLGLYSERQAHRHDVLPGISGFAQVNGRNAITWEQKFEYDVIYTEKIGFFLDLKIFAKTLLNVLRKEGINSENNIIMHKFTGNNINE